MEEKNNENSNINNNNRDNRGKEEEPNEKTSLLQTSKSSSKRHFIINEEDEEADEKRSKEDKRVDVNDNTANGTVIQVDVNSNTDSGTVIIDIRANLGSPRLAHKEYNHTLLALKRWLAREQLFWRLIRKVLLIGVTDYHQKRLPYKGISSNFLTDAVPIDDEKDKATENALRRLARLQAINDGVNVFAYKIWPATLLFLMLHDGIEHGSLPEQRRYGISSSQLFFDFYRVSWGWGSSFNDGFPNAVNFWLLPSILLLTPVATSIAAYFCRPNVTPDADFLSDSLDNVRDTEGLGCIKHFLPLSAYRRALQKIAFSYRWQKQKENSSGEDLLKNTKFDPIIQLTKIEEIARRGNFFLSLPALSALTAIADNLINYAPVDLSEEAAVQRVMLEIPEYPLQYLRNIHELGGVRGFIAGYNLWTLSQSRETRKSMLALYWSLLATDWGLTGYLASGYLAYRYCHIIYQCIATASFFFNARAECQTQGNVWLPSPVTGDYACSVCGDWPYVRATESNDPQACLTALLSEPRDFQELSNGIKRLKDRDGIYEMDISAWSWVDWNTTQAKQIFGDILALSDHWNLVNVSSRFVNPIWPNDGKAQILGNLLNPVEVKIFDASNLNMGEAWNSLLFSWSNPHGLRVIRANRCGLGDQEIINTSAWMLNNSLSIDGMHLSGNTCTVVGVTNLLPALNQTSELVLTQNALLAPVVDELANWIPDHPIETLILNENDFTGANFTNFSQVVCGSQTLTTLGLADVQMDDEACIAFSAGFQNQTCSLITLNLSHNNALSDQGIVPLIQSTSRYGFRVNLGYNGVDDLGLQNIMTVLVNSNWQGIDLSGNPLTNLGPLWANLGSTQIRVLVLSDLSLNQNAFAPLISLLAQDSITLESIDVSRNYLSSDWAGQLLNTACHAGVRTVIMKDCGLTSEFFNQLSDFADYTCEEIILSGNQFTDGPAVNAFINSLSQTPIKILDLSVSQLADGTALTLSQNLFTPVPNPGDLALNSPSFDEIRVWGQSHPNTQLETVNLEGTEITATGARSIAHALSHAPDVDVTLPNDLDSWQGDVISSANRLDTGILGILLRPLYWLKNSVRDLQKNTTDDAQTFFAQMKEEQFPHEIFSDKASSFIHLPQVNSRASTALPMSADPAEMDITKVLFNVPFLQMLLLSTLLCSLLRQSFFQTRKHAVTPFWSHKTQSSNQVNQIQLPKDEISGISSKR